MKPTAMLLIIALFGAAPLARADCEPYTRTHPGGDYTNADDRQGLGVVEHYHFTPNIEQLIRGNSANVGAEIDYTLRHFPNHHRALASMAKLGLREKSGTPSGATFSIVCYFDRAIRFVPGDAKVRMIYGAYLMAANQPEQALDQLREAARLSPDNPTVNYNLGLMYLKRKDYAQARKHAQRAYALGFPLPGLKNQLSAAGQWEAGPAGATRAGAGPAAVSPGGAVPAGAAAEDAGPAGNVAAGVPPSPEQEPAAPMPAPEN